MGNMNLNECLKVSSAFHFFKGRVALYAILKAMGIKEGDEVIIPGFTCVVVPNAITYLGAKPVYVDINPKTYNIDVQKLEELFATRYLLPATHPKIIIAQHTFGIPAEMDKIMEISKKYNLYVIEDSCHAIGSKYKGEEVGTIGNAAFFSSQWSKPVTTGLGGWAVINREKGKGKREKGKVESEELRERMEEIYNEFTEPSSKEVFLLKLQYLLYSKFLTPSLFWFAMNTYRKLSGKGIGIGSSDSCELECEKPTYYEKKMSKWQKDLLERKLKEIDKIIEHRKWVVALYEKLLPEIGIETVKYANNLPITNHQSPITSSSEPVFLRYPILVKDKKKVLKEAEKQRIEIGDWFISPIHPNLDDTFSECHSEGLVEALSETKGKRPKNLLSHGGWAKVGYQKGMCPIAEDICKHIINLPTHTKINESEVKRIIKFLEKYR